jgi:Zn-dependent protease with chaperone function
VVSATLLLAYGTIAGTLGAGWLLNAHWPMFAPRLAIAAWQALAASVLLSLSAAGLALSVSFPHVRADLARLFNLCAENLSHGYAAPGGVAVATIGLGFVLAVFVRTTWCAIGISMSERRERAARIAVLDLVGRTDIIPGAVVIDHDAPYAFCVGGKRHHVVLTSALLATLSERQLEAVLAHEEAHLRQRHHVALVICRALFGTLAPAFPIFRRALARVRLYAELAADDRARRAVGEGPLHEALATLACLPAPAGTLAATGNDVEARLLRLTGRHRPLSHARSAMAGFAIGAALLVPLALAAAPALSMAWEGICLIG